MSEGAITAVLGIPITPVTTKTDRAAEIKRYLLHLVIFFPLNSLVLCFCASDRLLHFYKQTAICARDYESNSSEQVGVHYSLVLTF